MDFFERQWSSFRAIVDHDLIEHHRSVADWTAEELKRWLSKRPASASAPSMVDFGCGDLALLAPMVLGPVPYTTH